MKSRIASVNASTISILPTKTFIMRQPMKLQPMINIASIIFAVDIAFFPTEVGRYR